MPTNREYMDRVSSIYRELPTLRRQVDAGIQALHGVTYPYVEKGSLSTETNQQARQSIHDSLETLSRLRVLLLEVGDLLEQDRIDTEANPTD